MAENTRVPREFDTRAKAERPKKWMPPTTLPDPNPEEGYVYRWVRVSTLGNADPGNISGKFREGWEPVKAANHPEIHLLGSGETRFPGCIEIGGLILCKIPKELAEQREAYYSRQAEGQMESVDNAFMRENNPRMPLFRERQTQVKFGRGSHSSEA
jgi:hypothetical protein